MDEAGDGKITKAEMKKFLTFVNETQGLGLPAAEVDALNDEIFTELGKTELTLEDVRDVAAARWGAWWTKSLANHNITVLLKSMTL